MCSTVYRKPYLFFLMLLLFFKKSEEKLFFRLQSPFLLGNFNSTYLLKLAKYIFKHLSHFSTLYRNSWRGGDEWRKNKINKTPSLVWLGG